MTLKIPIIDQQFCDKEGANCVRKSFCSEHVMQNNKWVWKQNHELKFCHGNIGINSGEYVKAQAFANDVQLWVSDTLSKLERCESKNIVPQD